MTAAVMNVKTHEIRKVIQYARFPPAAIPVEKVTLTPPMKHKAAAKVVSTSLEIHRRHGERTKGRREVVELVVGAMENLKGGRP